jgi:hypothetical protein
MHDDESTDADGFSVVPAFVSHTQTHTYKNQVEQDVLACIYLPINIIGEDIYYLTDLYVAEKGLSWKQCVELHR